MISLFTAFAVLIVGFIAYGKATEKIFAPDDRKTPAVAAADGVETIVEVTSIYAKGRGDGHLLVAKKDGYYGVIDWHGNVILPFEHKNLITITDDGKALIRSSTGYELDAIIIEE